MALPWWAAAARRLLAAVFAATALGKLLDPPGFAGVLAEYRLVPPPLLLLPLALALGLGELAIAAGLARRCARRRSRRWRCRWPTPACWR